MKSTLLAMLAALLVINAAYAVDEVSLLADEMFVSGTIDEDEDETATKNNENEDSSGSIFGFIVRPLSKIFGSDDDVTQKEEGAKESYLERSIRLAGEGSLEDQMNLAYMYLYGTNGVEQDFAASLKYYTMAAEQNDPIALNNLGSLYFNGIGTQKNIKKALEMFKKASILGNSDASVNLAFIYLTGGPHDTERNRMAVELFEKAHEKNNIAKFMLGYAYYKGFVVDRNYEQAFKLIKAAAGGDAMIDEAQLTLAGMYINGEGTVQNYQKAIEAYRAAVMQGNIEAIMTLAGIYNEGKITPRNPVLAHALYNIAAAQNVALAAKKREELSKELPLEALTKAQETAQNYNASASELTNYIRQTYGLNIRNYINNNIIIKPEQK